jgi:hypothetical protein
MMAANGFVGLAWVGVGLFRGVIRWGFNSRASAVGDAACVGAGATFFVLF